MKWKIVDSEREDFIKKQLLNPRKGAVRLDSSGPNSPAIGHPPSQATERLLGALAHAGPSHQRKSASRSTTPQLDAYPTANESFTPDRGPRPQNSMAGFRQSSPVRPPHNTFATPAKRLFQESNVRESVPLVAEPSSPNGGDPKPDMAGLRDHSANSPPPLYSDSTVNAANGGNRGLVTPLVSRYAPRLAPPSTAQVPSQYMNFSSPAPFWKYVDLPSTPAKQPLDLSPIKLKREEDADKEGEDEHELAQPSSPPIIDNRSQEPEDEDQENQEDANEGEGDNENDKDEDMADMTPDSPTRTVSRPVSRAHLPGAVTHSHSRSRSNSHANGLAAAQNGGMVRGASLGSFQEEIEDEGGFDLAK